MSVKIGHSSIDEGGGISGGQPGDQTGREVRLDRWWQGGWTLLLRPAERSAAEKMAAACEAGCRNEHIGYCQGHRNDLRAQARAANWDLSKIKTPTECDCSSFMAVCAEAAGIDMGAAYTGANAPATFQMRTQYAKTGAFQILTDSRYLTSDRYLRRGDILVNEARHTVMVLEDGADAAEKNGEIILNGKTYPIDRLLVGGKNYFAIRELAEVLQAAGVCTLKVSSRGNVAVLETK